MGKTPEALLRENVRWSGERTAADPGYFRRLSGLQAPEFLWIGCSDSRVPANVITGLEPGEVFVHRNVANLVYPADLNCMSVLQFAVETLKVKHIIVCGHYGCGGVRAVLDGSQSGLVEHWLAPVRDLFREHRGRACRPARRRGPGRPRVRAQRAGPGHVPLAFSDPEKRVGPRPDAQRARMDLQPRRRPPARPPLRSGRRLPLPACGERVTGN